MNRILKIGFLFPYSSICPNMSKDIIDGFNAAIPSKIRTRFQFFPEYIHQGGTEIVAVAINKLINFHNVDIVSGIINYKLIPDINKILGKKKKLGFFFDMGEYLPPLIPISENIFFNSFMLWQQEYALGEWSQKTFGGKGAILISVYDSGYHMHSSFWHGAIASGASEIDLHILPFDVDNNSIKHFLPSFFEKIEKAKVDYLHTLFCGNEAVEFYEAFKVSNLNGKIPLVVSPHMASDEILQQTNFLNIKSYSASGWDYYSNEKINKTYKSEFENIAGRKASTFGAMGYEFGLAILNTLSFWRKDDFVAILNSFKNDIVLGPRGPRNFCLGSYISVPPVTIEKIVAQGLTPKKMVIAQETALSFNNSVFEETHTQSISGWKNPYLCI